jgi:hypothetical protein
MLGVESRYAQTNLLAHLEASAWLQNRNEQPKQEEGIAKLTVSITMSGGLNG